MHRHKDSDKVTYNQNYNCRQVQITINIAKGSCLCIQPEGKSLSYTK